MKPLKTMCAMACLAAALGTAHAGTTMTVKVPYPFTASGVSMPAGTYHVLQMQPSGVMLLRAPDGRSVMFMSRPGGSSGGEIAAGLTFRNVGGKMVLADVNDTGSGRRAIAGFVK